MKVAIGWALSSYTGWGVYGINLALELEKRGVEARSTHVAQADQIVVDPLRRRLLDGFIRRSNMQQPVPADHVLLHALGNDALPHNHTARIGIIFFEEPPTDRMIKRLNAYDIVITGSSWNEEVLKDCGLTNVRTVIQGVDRSIFHPGPRRNLYPGKFLIFSGGKAEPRKGQDIVVQAFRVFAQRHPEAMLVTAWHSPWPHLAKGMDLDLSEFADRVIDVGQVPNGQMASVYRECHVGLFPSRGEGGTNLVAMECVACGVPIVAYGGTGHRDLIRLAKPAAVYGVPPDGDIEKIVAGLEMEFDALRGRYDRPIYHFDPAFPTWGDVADQILQAVSELQ